jgi:hypothetical protein
MVEEVSEVRWPNLPRSRPQYKQSAERYPDRVPVEQPSGLWRAVGIGDHAFLGDLELVLNVRSQSDYVMLRRSVSISSGVKSGAPIIIKNHEEPLPIAAQEIEPAFRGRRFNRQFAHVALSGERPVMLLVGLGVQSRGLRLAIPPSQYGFGSLGAFIVPAVFAIKDVGI